MATIVVLNGTSSSGKTAIARAFQDLAPRVFLNFSLDDILYALPPNVIAGLERGERLGRARFLELVRAFHACARELARLGHDLVIDHAIGSRDEAEMLAGLAESNRMFLVRLDCPLDVLEERERRRGDRAPGLAAAQAARVHQWLDYDLAVDTSTATPDDAARLILAALPRD